MTPIVTEKKLIGVCIYQQINHNRGLRIKQLPQGPQICLDMYTVSQKKNCATFIFTVTLANVGRFLKFLQCRNQKEKAHNKNEKFPTVA